MNRKQKNKMYIRSYTLNAQGITYSTPSLSFYVIKLTLFRMYLRKKKKNMKKSELLYLKIAKKKKRKTTNNNNNHHNFVNS